MNVDKMTDSELVERVAREVLNLNMVQRTHDPEVTYIIDGNAIPRGKAFRPFIDMNDLFRMLEKFDGYMIYREAGKFWCRIFVDGLPIVNKMADTMPRAVLEAALEVKGAERCEK